MTVTPRALKNIIDGAVTTALESAHRQWFQYLEDDPEKILKRSNFISPRGLSSAPTSRFRQQRNPTPPQPPPMSMSNEKKQRVAEYDVHREMKSSIVELERKLARLEGRVSKVEKNFDVEELETMLGVGLSGSRENGGSVRQYFL